MHERNDKFTCKSFGSEKFALALSTRWPRMGESIMNINLPTQDTVMAE